MAELKSVIEGAVTDLEFNLRQVMPVGLEHHIRLVVSVRKAGTHESPEVIQVDGGQDLSTVPAKVIHHGETEVVRKIETQALKEAAAYSAHAAGEQMPPCSGQGKCHGPLQWCNTCGDVGEVCDALEGKCDCHKEALQAKREREVLRGRKEEAQW